MSFSFPLLYLIKEILQLHISSFPTKHQTKSEYSSTDAMFLVVDGPTSTDSFLFPRQSIFERADEALARVV